MRAARHGPVVRICAALLALAALSSVSACSALPAQSVAPSVTPDPCGDELATRLREAVDATLATRTLRFDQTMSFTGSEQFPDGPYGFMSGRASVQAPRQVVAETSFPSAPLGRLNVLILQNLLLMRGQYIDLVLGPGKWLMVDLTSDDPRAAEFVDIVGGHNDAFVALYFLYGPTGDVRDQGVEKIDGVSTRRWTADVSLERAAECAPATASEHLLDSAGSLGWGRTAKADAWVDSEGRIRAIHSLFALEPEQGGGQLRIEYTFDDFGEPLDIDIPPDEDIVALEDVPGMSPPT